MENRENTPQSATAGLDRRSFLLLACAAALNALTWASLYWKLPPTDDTFFLHYNIYFGVDQTGGWSGLLWIPATGAALVVLNTLMLFALRTQPPTLQRVVAGMTTLLCAGLFVAMWLLINSNLS